MTNMKTEGGREGRVKEEDEYKEYMDDDTDREENTVMRIRKKITRMTRRRERR